MRDEDYSTVSAFIPEFRYDFYRVSRDTLPTAICTGLAVNGAEDFITVVALLLETRKEDQEMRTAIISGLGCISTERDRKRQEMLIFR